MRSDSLNDVGNHRGGALLRLADIVLKHRRKVILLWVILFILGGIGSGSVQKRLDVDFALPGQPGYEATEKMLAKYGNGAMDASLLVMNLPEGQSVESERPQIETALNNLRNEYPNTRFVDYFSTGNPIFKTNDERTTYAMAFVPMPTTFAEAPLSVKIEDALQQQLPTAKVTATGNTELTFGSTEEQDSSVLLETVVAGLGALAVLAFVFASFLAIVPLMIAAVAILTTLLIVLGLTHIADVSFVVMFLVTLVGLGVAVDYSLLLVTRWREELQKGSDNIEAIRRSMATAGHAVLLSGLTVAIGLVALVVLPVPSLRSVGYGGMLIPLVSTAVVLTLLPAFLAGAGRKFNWPKFRHDDRPSRMWSSWAKLIVRRRWIAAIASTAALIVMIIPVFDLKIGTAASDSLAKHGAPFEAMQTLYKGGLPNGLLTPIQVMVEQDSAASVAERLRNVNGIESVAISNAPDSNKGSTTVLVAIPAKETTNSATTTPVKDAREALDGVPGVIGITGIGATQLDYVDAVFGNAPLVFAIIAILTFLLLTRAFHSVLLAFKALVLNVISLAAIFGVMTFIWQQGHGSEAIFDTTATGAITFWVPTMVFAFLFGLSMDYEVFILARMREEYDRSGSTSLAVIEGIGRTGRLVTSAALILFFAFASMALSGFTDLKVLATGLGVGILLDATLVRAFLLPALVSLFGEWNWWMPQWLATILRTEVPPKPAALETPESSNAA